MKIKSEFKVIKWEQNDIDGILSGNPIMRVSAVFEATKKIEGKFLVEYLMHYKHHNDNNPHDAKAVYTGFMIFDGTINGKTGTFTLEDSGVYENTSPTSVFKIVDCSGTGDFIDISGTGKYYENNQKMIIEIDYI